MNPPSTGGWLTWLPFGRRKATLNSSTTSSSSPELDNNQGALFAGYDGAQPDYERARECFERAAEAGYAMAQNNLGLLFALGRGVLRDEAEASRWFRRAAIQGDAGAQFNLGNLCHPASLGQLVGNATEARVQAYTWFALAAAQGYLKAEAACETLNVQMSDSELNEGRRRVAAFAPQLEHPVTSQPL
jgi:TPR repeat protein